MSQIARLEASWKCPGREGELQPRKRKADSRGDLTRKSELSRKLPGHVARLTALAVRVLATDEEVIIKLEHINASEGTNTFLATDETR
jgi:hypothetical protein